MLNINCLVNIFQFKKMVSYKKYFYYIFLNLFVLMIFGPQINYYNNEIGEIIYSPLKYFLDGFILISILFVFIIFTSLIFNLFIQRLDIIPILKIFLIYFLITIINPVIEAGGSDMKGFNSQINFIFFFLNIFFSFLIYLIFFKNFKFQKVFEVILFIITFVFLFINYFIYVNSHSSKPIELGMKNIIVFSFDGIPGHIMNKLLNDDFYNEVYKDFVIYKNAFSHSPATYSSMFNELFGSYNWKNIAETESDLRLLSKSFLNLDDFLYLNEANIYGLYNEFSPLNASINKILPLNLIDQHFEILSETRLISSSLCKSGFCFHEKYGWLENYINKLFKHYPSFRKNGDMVRRKTDYKALIYVKNNIAKIDKEFGSFFGHFTFSHYPIFNNKDCTFSQEIDQTEKSIEEQTICVLKEMAKLIQKLKKEDLYDNSLIVFKSDHGKPISYYNEGIRSKKIFSNSLWGYDRYRPFTLIKFPNLNENKIKIIEEIFYLSDLSKIYCENYYQLVEENVEEKCSNLSKHLSTNYKMFDNRDKYLYVPQFTEDFRFGGHEAFKMPRRIQEIKSFFYENSLK